MSAHDAQPRGSAKGVRLAGVGALVVALAALASWAFFATTRRPPGPLAFADRARCVTCHERQVALWQGSHHDHAMGVASEQMVLGDFDDAVFEHHGVATRFFRRERRYWVITEGPDGSMQEYRVLYTLGWDPLQQVLVDIGDGRIQCLQIAWDTRGSRWMAMQEEHVQPGDARHWTGVQFNWNSMCATCHATDLQRAYDAQTNGYQSTWLHADVGCQTCHGPGSRHLAWADRKGTKDDDPTLGLVGQGKQRSAEFQIEHCARCHSRRVALTGSYRYGEPLLEQYAPALLTEPLYHPDGQTRAEAYVYGSFLQATKHERGVRCTDCHDPHSARLTQEGNALCAQCHRPEPPKWLPTLRKHDYDRKEHHFHEPGKPGSFCVDCHMTATTTMRVDPRRDHSFRVPRPDLTESLGVPNACNGCHEDKSTAWAVAETAKRHPGFVTARVDAPHFATALAGGRAGDPRAFVPLAKLGIEKGEPAIVRATAVHHLARYPAADAVRAIVPALSDADGLVRAAAAEALGIAVPAPASTSEHTAKARALVPLLDDRLRLVRMAAARALAGPAEASLPATARTPFTAALDEFVAQHEARTDRPDAHLELGALHEARGATDAAEAAYLRAVELDPQFLPARSKLAALFRTQGRLPDAEAHLLAITEADKEHGDAWYALGLLRAERADDAGAAEALAHAVRLIPGRAHVLYRHALALQATGDLEAADQTLERAQVLDERDPAILRALVHVCIARNAWGRAGYYVGELARLEPDAKDVAALRTRIEAARER